LRTLIELGDYGIAAWLRGGQASEFDEHFRLTGDVITQPAYATLCVGFEREALIVYRALSSLALIVLTVASCFMIASISHRFSTVP